MNQDYIIIEGARQNNLKNLNIKIPLKKMIVITGVSGSGKSSLAFDTIYAEGQRRYVETFSSYARQFLDRMDKPDVEKIEGIPPAIAIDQTNPVRTSRSTVGTMTEINDHLKLLYSRASFLVCQKCGAKVKSDNPGSICEQVLSRFNKKDILITFPVHIPQNFSKQEVVEHLSSQGYTRIYKESEDLLELIQDRVNVIDSNKDRLVEDLEAALKYGNGKVTIHPADASTRLKKQSFSSGLHCAECDIQYKEPTAGLFSFNSPVGACENCKGFGRVIGVDYDLVIPDWNKTLKEGAVKPWQTKSYSECQDEMMKFARKAAIPVDVAWKDLTAAQKEWVLEGEGSWEDGKWYGVHRFFQWLETKSYKMHIRVLLSRYRAYHICPSCNGARLKPEAFLWRLGEGSGLTIHDLMLLPIDKALEFFQKLILPAPLDEAAELVLQQIRTRLKYLVEAGLGYLTLDRQSRTLSGGEVQRINLTTALGTSLVNALFILDEPSIGLHSRDINRLIGVLHHLRDADNTIIVVEHDPEVIRAADYVLDMGPGPGERGGEAVFWGTLNELFSSKTSKTAPYLSGKKKIEYKHSKLPEAKTLVIKGAAEHNLKNIDVSIPLKRLVCITGVSGSGKSTLMQEICYHGLKKLKGQLIETPGKFTSIENHELISDVILVDQASIGKTTRSNPVSYIGAFDEIRSLFAKVPLAQSRGYTASDFSFNSGTGRCPVCNGSGFEHVEMQFLSDVYIRCPECDGKRYRSEILEIKLPAQINSQRFNGTALSISEILELTVDDACDFFTGPDTFLNYRLSPLRDVGLSYVRLGQPLPTLSGGEAQRLKLAGYLAERLMIRDKDYLFLFDEPTTGLHFEDIGILMNAFRKLLDEGHSVVVIEHNLDVISGADWIIDMGPEGGAGGGRIVFTGTPEQIVRCEKSYTGKALKQYEKNRKKSSAQNSLPLSVMESTAFTKDEITIRRAREHNLKDINLTIPRNQFTVITGVSGSGKSTVAFDILFAEGQRRYLESLNAYARQFIQPASRPDVDAVLGIPPTVAIEQRTSRGGRKSTVATVTEIYHFLRLLFVKIGVQNCPDCGIPIAEQSEDEIITDIMKCYQGSTISVFAPLIVNRKGSYSDLAVWASKHGYFKLRIDGEIHYSYDWPKLDRFKEHCIDMVMDDVLVNPENEKKIRETLGQAFYYGKETAYIETNKRGRVLSRIFSRSRSCPQCRRSFDEPDPRLFSFNSRHGWCPNCFGTGLEMSGFNENQTGEEIIWNDWWDGNERICQVCNGKRLKREALSVLLNGKSIDEYTALSVKNARTVFGSFKFSGRDALIAGSIITELLSRLQFLEQVGLDYLSLDRAAPTLSGGEAQRIRLAAQLGTNLKGVCYILDEPTIGLHARDNLRLLDTLFKLKEKGNTVVVVEHDEETIRRAQHLIDLGPGGGKTGGSLIAQGTVKDILKSKESLTGYYLKKPLLHNRTRRTVDNSLTLHIKSATLHNLKSIDVSIPMGAFVCVTGVSGSGKSTLIRDILYRNLKERLSDEKIDGYYGCKDITGWNQIGRILEVDQSPIGKTPRSCPATYVGIMDEIRKIFAKTPEAIIRGYSASRFSFNTDNGRCPSCDGQGMKKIEMSFLPDVIIPCETCEGQRFTPETLAVKFKDKSIAQILNMNIDEAVEFFTFHNMIHHDLKLLQETGLGYLTLGQQSPTLSGGEAQRIKLVTELGKARTQPKKRSKTSTHTMYILDEPTVGLHMADVDKLIRVLHRLVDAGNSVVIIEHNLDMIAEADWIIDLGPEGGEKGGVVVAQGTPEQIIKQKKKTHTSRFLKELMFSHGA
ncbi:MAG TPA: excinuclease ABC subunit UvrA [Chitinispirillaceae bacterium]|nr:excinuclease ABC subunit UvrA [Chitinispirillaceae bacterium]